MGAQYASKSEELESSKLLSASQPDGITREQAVALQSDAESAGTISAISIGVGAAALIGGIVMFATHSSDEGESTAQASPLWLAPLLPVQRDDDRAGVVLGFSY